MGSSWHREPSQLKPISSLENSFSLLVDPLQPPNCWPQVHRGKKFKAQLFMHDLPVQDTVVRCGATSPIAWKRSSFKQNPDMLRSFQWCSKLLKLSWAQSVCVLAGCNLRPCVQCELPALCRDQRCGCSWHLLTRPLRNRHNNVPFTGQMMSNCEEEFGQEG